MVPATPEASGTVTVPVTHGGHYDFHCPQIIGSGNTLRSKFKIDRNKTAADQSWLKARDRVAAQAPATPRSSSAVRPAAGSPDTQSKPIQKVPRVKDEPTEAYPCSQWVDVPPIILDSSDEDGQ